MRATHAAGLCCPGGFAGSTTLRPIESSCVRGLRFAAVRRGLLPVLSALLRLAAQARVRLHVLVADVHGRLDAGQLTAALPQWREADFWFCGPAGFGRALRADLVGHGLAEDRFHQELFEMR